MSNKMQPKTLNGYIKLLDKVEHIIPSHMKGFDNLPKTLQDDLNTMQASISNFFNAFKDDYESLLNAKSL